MEHKAFMTQTLETSDALASPQVIQLALSAVQRYHAQCFWFRSPDAEVETVGDVLLVIQRLPVTSMPGKRLGRLSHAFNSDPG